MRMSPLYNLWGRGLASVLIAMSNCPIECPLYNSELSAFANTPPKNYEEVIPVEHFSIKYLMDFNKRQPGTLFMEANIKYIRDLIQY